MTHKPASLLCLAMAISLIGLGCTKKEEKREEKPQVKQAIVEIQPEKEKTEKKEETKEVPEENTDTSTSANTLLEGVIEAGSTRTTQEQDVTTDITLNGTVLGPNTALFTWNVSDAVDESSEGYKIVRGTDPNPVDPAGWWWQRGPSHREHTWVGLPEGTAYFRLCILENDACIQYSNAVLLEIPSKVEGSNIVPANTGGPEERPGPCPHKNARVLATNFFTAITEGELKIALELVDADTVQTSEFKEIWEHILTIQPEQAAYKKLFHDVGGDKERKDIQMRINEAEVFTLETTRIGCQWWITAITQ
ncbi:MAG: hypothetical protein HOL80_00265 [Candidatus Magasanikbacteria bacterium]|jgi:hypothetical protein|nr:hypothetical protein [Candidatus Magasanikbacteria bacterium]MBT5262314.1 hypothetical protein [Candidatus Magasanikbacteria bacterium]MBT5820501.1 hypothetical protein [Candidatus Magasanikbacteria bacterium]MBT6294176.1 hypothetical protein [Candidatus Magasanikbacteria bacterium]